MLSLKSPSPMIVSVLFLLTGGMIEGVLYQCHPTPKNFSGLACAPALRVFRNGTNRDFLVDEECRNVIFVPHDTPTGALT